jgi:predicted ferric reductase
LNFAWIAGGAGAGPYMSGLKKIIFQKVVVKQFQNGV